MYPTYPIPNYESAFLDGSPPKPTPTPTHLPSFDLPDEPGNLREALSGPDANLWLAANDREMKSQYKNHVFTIVRRPNNHNVVGTKFVFRIKDSETAKPLYKSRLVARGFTQIPGQDFDDTFAPVPKATTIRFMFSYAAGKHLHVHHFDVETAFLLSEIDKILYAEQPAGYEDPQHPAKDWVLLLKKGLYGLKQSNRLWSNNVKKKLLSIGFRQSDADEAVFIREDEKGGTLIVAVYVDDFLVASDSKEKIESLEKELSQSYTINNLGPVKRFLGINVYRPTPTGPIYLSQSTYARKILHRFGMQNCNPAKSPFTDTHQLHKRREDEEPADIQLYSEMVGSIGYLPTYTRPDLAFAVSKLSQYLSNPSVIHMAEAKHVLRYIKGTLDLGPYYSAPPDGSESLPICFTDASHAADPDDRKSHSGHLALMNGGSISHSSSKQSITALSSMECEYIGGTNAAQEVVFLRKLYTSLTGKRINIPTPIFTDSEAALNHTKNNVNHSRTKHIDTRYHYIREIHTAGLIDLQHIPASEQAADILTKPLGPTKHAEAVKMLQLTPFPFENVYNKL
jgi:hypothetical protein